MAAQAYTTKKQAKLHLSMLCILLIFISQQMPLETFGFRQEDQTLFTNHV